MAARITQLPQAVIDRIAAGEVVERPASVVKELIENGLDAGSRRIEVTVEGGGLQLLRVSDDGTGLAEADLPLAFAAHATSKLSDVEDLQHIASFGFRGEALASIGAVARCRLTSACGDDGRGQRLTCEGGASSAPAPVAAPRGTTVEVRDLFFNTPARRAFLGSERTEAARCREVVACMALAHVDVAFRLVIDGKERLRLGPSAGLDVRLAEIYDEDFAGRLLAVSGADGPLALVGRVSAPADARVRPRAQVLFVNGRLVRDRGVASAVRLAARDFLPGALQPSWILALTADPALVDVNVHPTKAELRFRDKERIFGLVRRSCRQALLAADLAPRVRLGPPALPPDGPLVPRMVDEPVQPAAVREALVDPWRASRPGAPTAGPGPRSAPASAPLLTARPVRRFLQVLKTYLVHDSDEGLVIVDQHALHERILYSRLQTERDSGRLASQRLLIPLTIHLSPTDLELVVERASEFAALGLEVAPFGNDLLAISAVPAVLRNEDPTRLLEDLLHPRDLHGGIPDDLDRRLFTMACHAAVKAGEPLTELEATALLEQGAALEHDATCPHGRPTRLVVSRSELERLFKRSGF